MFVAKSFMYFLIDGKNGGQGPVKPSDEGGSEIRSHVWASSIDKSLASELDHGCSA